MVEKKLKSSALIIAIMVGILMSLIVIGASSTISEQLKNSAQSRDGRLAYRAAISGLEDGLLRVKYAKSAGKLDSAYNLADKVTTSATGGVTEVPKMNYDLTIKTTSITTNTKETFTSWSKLAKQSRPSGDSTSSLKKINVDDTLDLDLTYSIKKESLSKLTVYFSDPQISNSWIDGFTALDVKLVDVSGNLGATGEQQLKYEKTNTDINAYTITIDAAQISKCNPDTSQCHLRIRPQIASSFFAGRLTGLLPKSSAGKYIYYGILALDTNGNVIENHGEGDPGSISIVSVGYAGHAQRKLEAVIDTSSGTYQGMFDFGVYCGTKCDNLSSNLSSNQ
jgi:type II secretory pathway pseudopilin PulG